MAVRRKVQSEHYVNNKEFLEALIVFKAKCAAAKEAGEQRPQISNYIGAVSYTHLTLPTT